MPPYVDRAGGQTPVQVQATDDQSDMIQVISHAIGRAPLCGSPRRERVRLRVGCCRANAVPTGLQRTARSPAVEQSQMPSSPYGED